MTISNKLEFLLKLIMDDYISSGEPVGSKYLVDKHQLEMSSATVRNIMADLAESGYLMQLHTSSGRVPTPKAYRYYVQFLMPEPAIPAVFPGDLTCGDKNLANTYELLSFLSDNIARHTASMGVAMIDGKIAYSGLSNLFDYDEFTDLGQLRTLISLIENTQKMSGIFMGMRTPGVRFFIGENLFESAENFSIAVANCFIGQQQAYMSAIGPLRMNYERVMGTLQYLANLQC